MVIFEVKEEEIGEFERRAHWHAFSGAFLDLSLKGFQKESLGVSCDVVGLRNPLIFSIAEFSFG